MISIEQILENNNVLKQCHSTLQSEIYAQLNVIVILSHLIETDKSLKAEQIEQHAHMISEAGHAITSLINQLNACIEKL
jgi:hypothetical protein